MFSGAPILIAEDNLYLALDLSIAIEEMDGRVVGPAPSVADALKFLATHHVAAAIVDCQLIDRECRSARSTTRGTPGAVRHPHCNVRSGDGHGIPSACSSVDEATSAAGRAGLPARRNAEDAPPRQ